MQISGAKGCEDILGHRSDVWRVGLLKAWRWRWREGCNLSNESFIVREKILNITFQNWMDVREPQTVGILEDLIDVQVLWYWGMRYNAISWWSRAEFKPMAILEVGRGTVTLWAKGIYPWPCTDLSNGSMRQNIISDMWSPDIPVNLITGLKCYQIQGHCSHRSLWKRLSRSYVTQTTIF